MMMHLLKYGIVILLLVTSYNSASAERWFTQAVVDYGAPRYQENCAVCHGVNAEGTKEWKKLDENGNYPPPPLDGTAHAWHHSIPQLARSIKEGGIKLGGVMPAFGDKLSDQEVLAVIAYFQSKWPDEVYKVWHERNMQ